MTYSIKISLVGLSGSGKTTTLKALCPDAFLMAEQQRMPTEVEAKAWQISTNTPIPTSSVPNFAQLIFNSKYKKV